MPQMCSLHLDLKDLGLHTCVWFLFQFHLLTWRSICPNKVAFRCLITCSYPGFPKHCSDWKEIAVFTVVLELHDFLSSFAFQSKFLKTSQKYKREKKTEGSIWLTWENEPHCSEKHLEFWPDIHSQLHMHLWLCTNPPNQKPPCNIFHHGLSSHWDNLTLRKEGIFVQMYVCCCV